MSVRQLRRFASLVLVGLVALGSTGACKTGDSEREATLAEPDEAEGYLEDARDAVDANESEEAEAMLDLAAEAGADERELAEIRARLYRQRALAALDDDQPGRAHEWFVRAADIEPLDGARFEDLMRALRSGQDVGLPPADLAPLADHATNIVMSSRDAHKMGARLWDDAGEPERALPHYQWLHKVSPDDVGVKMRLATIHARLGHVDRAERLLASIRREQPDNVQAAIKLATLYERTSRNEKAQSLYEGLIDAFPDNSGIYFRYASFLERIGEAERARKIRQEAQERLPGVERRDLRRLR